MVEEIKSYKTKDLVLDINENIDPTKLDFSDFDIYLMALCNGRDYQKEAIKRAIIFLASGNYNSIEDVVKENFLKDNKKDLRSRYKRDDANDYIKHLQIKDKLSATIDLATGTGKSYVIYAIAQIMLCLGLVDKVLVLCPSITIENELKKKFVELSGNSILKGYLPSYSVWKNPTIISGDETIKEGCICVENIHAVYEGNRSSISDSLKKNGDRVLVLNDECHHIYNKSSDKEIKKWKSFLLDADFNFKYMLGFTGTAFIENEYFNDVIYRYSLRDAIENKFVKSIEYVIKDDSASTDEKFQKILDNHNEIKIANSSIKPLSILITKDVKSAKRLGTEFKEFLMKSLSISENNAKKKILIVTYHKDHKEDLARLPMVDSKDEPAEWIISVSMLTEGWDVKNVFQIVPWEDRAFNSKLLIAQVIGRGLRIPKSYSVQPKVLIFNHTSFSRNIKTLVEEVLEIERRLTSNSLQNETRKKYSFELRYLTYEKTQEIKKSEKEITEFDYSKGYIKLVSDEEKKSKTTEFEDTKGNIRSKKTSINYDTWTIDEILDKVESELKNREWEGKILKLSDGVIYSKDDLPPREELRKIIKNSMERVGITGERLTEVNKQRILNMFSTLLRKRGKTLINVRTIKDTLIIPTNSIEKESLGIGNLRKDCSVFYSTRYLDELAEEQIEILQDVIEDDAFVKSATISINEYLFKTPVDLVFTKGNPEKEFVKNLCSKENAKHIAAWLKSRNNNFYSIEYSLTSSGGKHSKTQSFNPDFFIRLIDKRDTIYTVVVEIKADKDNSVENQAKYKYAKQYFNDLNQKLDEEGIKEKYIFHFLSPVDYDTFFTYLGNDQLISGKFRGQLEDLLDI